MSDKELIAKLREAAGKATPGPWEAGAAVDEHGFEKPGWWIAHGPMFWGLVDLDKKENAKYVALANPENVLRLLYRLEEMEEYVDLSSKCLALQAQELSAATKEIDHDPFELWDEGKESLDAIAERMRDASKNCGEALAKLRGKP